MNMKTPECENCMGLESNCREFECGSCYIVARYLIDEHLTMTPQGEYALASAVDNCFLWANEIYESPDELWVELQELLKNPQVIYKKMTSWNEDGPQFEGSYEDFIKEVTTI